jgi:hypothetical protein
MQIGGISSMNSMATAFNPVLVAGPSSSASSGSAAALPSAGANAGRAISDSSSATAGGETSAGRGSREHGAAAAARSVAAETQVSSYSTSVAGQQYWGSVEKSGGDYTATVPNLAGATASGSSQQSAEDNLNARINEIV